MYRNAMLRNGEAIDSSRYFGEITSNDNSENLAELLSRPQNYDAVIANFKLGNSLLADIAKFSFKKRDIVLNSRTPESDFYAKKATTNLIDALNNQDLTGGFGALNFLINNESIIDSYKQHPVAQAYNQLFIVNQPGASRLIGLSSTLRAIRNLSFERQQEISQSILNKLALKENNKFIIGRFLALRSVIAESFHRNTYGSILEKAKTQNERTFLELAQVSGLAMQHVERTVNQIQLTDHVAFDHLVLGATEYDRKARGDYLTGTLRIRIMFAGSPAKPAFLNPKDMEKVARHETFHAASAQSWLGNGYRVGLCHSKGLGREVNEAMTEYQAQIAGGMPGINRRTDGSLSFKCSYAVEVATLHSLRARDPATFNVLFNGYYGQSNQEELAAAISKYYQILNRHNKSQ